MTKEAFTNWAERVCDILDYHKEKDFNIGISFYLKSGRRYHTMARNFFENGIPDGDYITIYDFGPTDTVEISIDCIESIEWEKIPEAMKTNLGIIKQIMLANWQDDGLFFTRNIVGDHMDTIWSDGNVTIDICESYEYFEVFGLSEKEQCELLAWYSENQKTKAR